MVQAVSPGVGPGKAAQYGKAIVSLVCARSAW